MKDSKIAWTHHTFNPWWGCAKVSPGCAKCYAETFAKRTGHNVWGLDAPRRFFGSKHWDEPLKWNKEAREGLEMRRVFVGSMCDWAETHGTLNDKLDQERSKLADLVRSTPWLTWMFLTKRIENAVQYLEQMFDEMPENLWIGTTAENQEQYDRRIPILASLDAAVRFVSVEPQLGPVSMFSNPTTTAVSEMIDLIIVGGESGPGCRPFNVEWAYSLLSDCREGGTAFFMKQLGGHPNKRDELEDLPADLQLREMP